MDYAEEGEALDIAGYCSSGLRKDELGEVAIIGSGIDFAGEDVFCGNIDGGFFVDVAVVVKSSGKGDRDGGREAGDGIIQDVAFVDGLAGDIGVDDARHLNDVFDIHAWGIGIFLILADDDGGILGAGGGVLGNGNGIGNIGALVGGEGAGSIL